MNIEDMNTQNTNNGNAVNTSGVTPVPTENPVNQVNDVNPVVQNSTEPINTQSTVMTFTPVDKVVQNDNPYIASPTVNNPQVVNNNVTTPVVDNTIAPVQTPVVNPAPLPPSPQSIPVNNQEVVVVNTKKTSTSNLIVVIFGILLIVFVYFLDDIIAYVEENFINQNSSISKNEVNLTEQDPYIKIDDSTSTYTLDHIRYYNFKKSGNNFIIFNYESDKNYGDISSEGIYVELLNAEKEILYVKLFNAEKVENTGVGSFVLSDLNDTLYKDSYYARVVIYTNEEKNSTSTLTCTYNDSNDNFLLEYKNTYHFKNNVLTDYDVSKKIEVMKETSETKTLVKQLTSENNTAKNFAITTTFENNSLTYNINLENINEGYKPLYDKNTTMIIVKNNEAEKKWICE